MAYFILTSRTPGKAPHVKHSYGGKRAVLKRHGFHLMAHMGMFRGFKQLDFARVERLVFVCKGNICRSPYAAVRARAAGLPAVSFGLLCHYGAPADPRAIANASKRGLDLGTHSNARLEPRAISGNDLLIGMEPAHGTKLLPIAKQTGAQVTLIGLWSIPINPYIHDPYGLTDNAFQSCFEAIDAGIKGIFARLVPTPNRNESQMRGIQSN